MKRIDFDRAFPETPDCVHASVQLAFQKGERQQMKMRSKTMSLLAIAAALVLLVGVAALAAGKLGAPRPDNVTLGQPISKTKPTAEPTTEPTVYCTLNGKYYHRYENCSGMENASATTPSEAQARGKQPCPVCLPDPDTVYYTSDGEYYHVFQACTLLPGATTADLSADPKTARTLGKEPCPNCLGFYCLDSRTTTVYAKLDDNRYHLVSDCGGMTDAIPISDWEALFLGLTPCPDCADKTGTEGELSNLAAQTEVSGDTIVPTEEDSATVYCTQEGSYYHSVSDCSGMQGALSTTQREARAMGKFRCQVCNAAEPESYDIFLKIFGHPLSTIFPGFQYERSDIAQTNLDGSARVVDWYVSDGKQEQIACTACYLDYDGVRKVSQFDFDFDHQFDLNSNQIDNAGVSENLIQLAPEPLHTALAACRKRLPTAPDYLSIRLDEDYNIRGGYVICWGSENQYGIRPQEKGVEWLQTPDGEIRILKQDYMADGAFVLEDDTEEILHAPTDVPCYSTQEGTYYHSRSDCSGMQGALSTSEREAQVMGKFRCPVCNAAQPESYDIFLKVFGHPLSTLFPGFEYERSEGTDSNQDGVAETVEWYVSDGTQEHLVCTLGYGVRDGVPELGHFVFTLDEFNNAAIGENFIQLVPEPLHTALAACRERLPAAPDWLSFSLDADYNVKFGAAACHGNEEQYETQGRPQVEWLQSPDGEIQILKPDHASYDNMEDAIEEILHAPTDVPCYYTPDGAYYHSVSDCSGMQGALSTSEREAQVMGKFRCQLCNAAEPESYDVFLKIFGHPLSTFFPGCEYERSESSDFNSDGVADAVDWYVSDGKQEQFACRLDYGPRYGPQQLYRFIFEFSEFNDASVSENFIHFSSEPLHTALEACRKRLPAAPDWLAMTLDEDYNVNGGIAMCRGSADQYETQTQVRSDVQWMQTPDGEIRILKPDYGPDGFELEDDTEEILHAPTGEVSIAEEDHLSF